MEDRQLYQKAAIRWLYEMELLQDPQLINNLKFNLFAISPHVKECEFLIFRDRKEILVFLELSWFGRELLPEQLKVLVDELLAEKTNSKVLGWLKRSWVGSKITSEGLSFLKRYHEKEIKEKASERLTQLLPSFRHRVVVDKEIFNLALEKVKEHNKGVGDETANPSYDNNTLHR
jgi:hypothetical protein